MTDHVDVVLSQWCAEAPELDVSPMAVIGRLSRACRLIEAELRATFARHELDAPSFDVLATLRRNGPPYQLSPRQLSGSAMVTSGAITQRLDRLEHRGLIRRTPNDADGRGVHVSLTAAGHAAIEAALPDHVATEHRLLAALSHEQRAVLAGALRDLLDSLPPADHVGGGSGSSKQS